MARKYIKEKGNMNKVVRFFLAMVAVFILLTDNLAFSSNGVKHAKNNKWVKSLRNAVLGMESQQANDIFDFIEKRLVMGKVNLKVKKIEVLEKKKVSNQIFLVSITEEDKKNPFWKGMKLMLAVQYIPAIKAIVINESEEFSQESMALALAREYWLSYHIIKGIYDSDTEWNSYAFSIRCMESLGGEGYARLAYEEAAKLSKEIEENAEWLQSYALKEPTVYDERLSFFLWEPASDEEALFMQKCFWIHTVFIMIENNSGLGYVAQQKAEFIKSISSGNALPAIDSLNRDYFRLYVK